jgi:hypothetical protein
MPSSNSFKEELKKLEGMLNRLTTKKSSDKVGGKGASKDESRFFKVVKVNGKAVEDGGRYELPMTTKTGKEQKRGPIDKASTAFTELCHKQGMKGECKMTFSIKETTQGSSKKTYHYEGKRVKLSPAVVLKIKDKKTGKTKEIVKKYRNVIKALGSE